jgi:hypothetical protein
MAVLDAAAEQAYGWPADLSADEVLKRLLASNLGAGRGGAVRRHTPGALRAPGQ